MDGRELFESICSYLKNNYDSQNINRDIIEIANEIVDKLNNDVSKEIFIMQFIDALLNFSESNNLCSQCRQ